MRSFVAGRGSEGRWNRDVNPSVFLPPAMEAKMAQAVHHHTEDSLPHAIYWATGICLAVVALMAFFIAYGGIDTLVADSGTTLPPMLW